MKLFNFKLVIFLKFILLNLLFSKSNFAQNYTNHLLYSYKQEYQNAKSQVLACINRDSNAVKNIFYHNVIDPNFYSLDYNNYFTLPLSEAIKNEDIATIKLLLKNGANPYLTSQNIKSPFDIAINLKNSKPIIEIILENYGLQGIDQKINYLGQYSYLSELIQNKKNEIAKLLIDKGVRINPIKIYVNTNDKTPFYSDSPLYIAVQSKNYEMVKYLIKKGANINAIFSVEDEDCISCSENITVMHTIVYEDVISKDIVNYLLKFKPNLNISNSKGFTALDNVCMNGNIELANLLIKNGAKIESKNRSALDAAIIYSNYKMALYLLNQGANPNFRFENGNTPLLGVYGIFGNGFGESISLNDRIKTLDVLMEAGANPNLKNNENEDFATILKDYDISDRKAFKDYFYKKWGHKLKK